MHRHVRFLFECSDFPDTPWMGLKPPQQKQYSTSLEQFAPKPKMEVWPYDDYQNTHGLARRWFDTLGHRYVMAIDWSGGKSDWLAAFKKFIDDQPKEIRELSKRPYHVEMTQLKWLSAWRLHEHCGNHAKTSIELKRIWGEDYTASSLSTAKRKAKELRKVLFPGYFS